MMSALLHQRRRLAVFVVCVLLGLALLDVPVPLVGAGFALAAAAVAVMLLPAHRRWIEATGLGLVLAALPPLAPDLRLPLALAAIVLVHGLLYGPIPNRLGLCLGLDRRRRSRVTRGVVEVWNALIPGECHPEDHWTSTLMDFDHDPDDAETVYLRHRTPEGGTDEATLTFIAREPYRHCRYLLERTEDGRPEEAVVTFDFVALTPGTCRIESRLQQDALPLGTALSRWFDDAFADELASFAATLQARPERGMRAPAQEDADALEEAEALLTGQRAVS